MSGPRPLGPEVFDPDAIDEETHGVNRLVETVIAQMPPMNEREPAEIRAEREEGKGPFPLQLLPEAEERTVPGPAGEIRLRTFSAQNPRGVLLHIHGGGWALGAAHHQDPLLKAISEHCRVSAVSVDYRLAPEAPYPAGPDDCEAAALWLARNAAAEFGTDRLLIGGESAGAHLSAVTLLRMRDRHGFTGFSGANLVFGCYDLTMTPSVRNWGDRNLILSTPIIEWFLDHFVPDEKRRDPDVSPLFADLSGLPPALFTVGTLDPLVDDSIFMHGRWLAAGNEAQLSIYPGCIHGFTAFPNKAGRASNDEQIAFLNRLLA